MPLWRSPLVMLVPIPKALPTNTYKMLEGANIAPFKIKTSLPIATRPLVGVSRQPMIL
ncbi:MAG: hypothetical protein N2V78_07845 [Methanophagales archaeon]|nr:hypothetical protein [Methanophagales archaeon]